MIVWYLNDGKPGHLNQVLGLVAALEDSVELETYEIPVTDVKSNIITWLFGNITLPQNIPFPDLIIGAGHRTHWPLLSLAKKTRAKTMVLMRPSLPLVLFDYVCAPNHDRLPVKKQCLSTEGAINRMHAGTKISESGLILMGGPSSHANWDDNRILKQLDELLTSNLEMSWKLTTSRRTPEAFVSKIKLRNNLEIFPWKQDEVNWLPEQMAFSEQVWVTPDSVSMIYEALTAEAKVGVFQLKIIPTRVSMGIEKLISDNIIVDFYEWKKNQLWPDKSTKLNEARRCASWLLKNMSLEN